MFHYKILGRDVIYARQASPVAYKTEVNSKSFDYIQEPETAPQSL